MTNKEILEKLLLRDSDSIDEEIPSGQSINGYMFSQYLKQWDGAEPFPMCEFRRYIRLNEWTAKDFNTRNELIIAKILPRWFYQVYLAVKEFKASSRNELLSTQDAFAKMMGYPLNTANDKAFCVYEYAIQSFYKEDV